MAGQMTLVEPLVVGDRIQVEIEVCDESGNTLAECEQYTGRGEGPFQNEEWHYAAVKGGRGQCWQLVLTDLDPPYRQPTGSGYVYTHNPVACHVHVDGVCIGSTPLFYIGHDVECMRGKKIGDVLHRFMFAVTDFKDTALSGGLEDVERTIESGGCVEIRLNEYEAMDKGTQWRPDTSRVPKQTKVPETEKTRQIKVSTQFKADAADEAAAAVKSYTSGPPLISRVDIKFLREIARGQLRYRDKGVLEARRAKRAKTDAAAHASSHTETTAGSATVVKKEENDIDLNDVKEVEVIDLTKETIDLTQED